MEHEVSSSAAAYVGENLEHSSLENIVNTPSNWESVKEVAKKGFLTTVGVTYLGASFALGSYEAFASFGSHWNWFAKTYPTGSIAYLGIFGATGLAGGIGIAGTVYDFLKGSKNKEAPYL